MKNKILNLTLTLIMLFVTLGTFAQSSTTATQKPAPQTSKALTDDEKADEHTKKLTAKLSLTNDQIPQVKALWMTSIKQDATDKKTAGSDQAKYKELKKQNDDTRMAGIRKILTPEQLKIYNAPVAKPAPKQAPASK